LNMGQCPFCQGAGLESQLPLPVSIRYAAEINNLNGGKEEK